MIEGLQINEIKSEILWRTLHFASLKFPLGLQIKFLSEIGFNLEEIRDIMFPTKPVKLASKSLPYTSEDYVPKMREQLEIFRQSNPGSKALELMSLLNSHQFETEPQKRIKLQSQE